MLSKQNLVVFPTSRGIRQHIQKEGSNQLLPSFLTIDDFLHKSITIQKKTYIDEEQRFLFLKEASNVQNLKQLGFSIDFLSFLKQSEYLFRFFSEISSEKVNIESLLQEDTYEYYHEHVTILSTIHKNYLKILDEHQVVDKINMPENYSINKEYVQSFGTIELYFEGYLTHVEFEIIQKISNISNVIIHFTSNMYNQKSMENFKSLNLEILVDYDYSINLSEKSIVNEKKRIKNLQNLSIKAFSNRMNQIAFIKESIQTIIQKGIEPSKIALVLPDESFVKQLQLFDNEGYFNYAMGKGIEQTNFYQYIFAVYNYLNDNEQKNVDALIFLDLETKEISSKFRELWSKNITIDGFNYFIDFLRQKETNKELLEKIDELIYKMNNLFFTKSQKILLKEAIKIFLQKLSKISLDDVNAGVITVMGLLETRMSSFEALILIDFNESFIPKRSIKDKFLSSSIKSKVGLPTLNDRENLQKYYYSKLIESTSDVFISYVHNETSQISRFAKELFFNVVIDETPQDEFYKDILFQNKKLHHFREEIIIPIDLSKQIWSATSLKNFLDCKRKYYFGHILHIKEHTSTLKPLGYELGNLVHNSLEELYTDFKLENITYKRLMGILEKNSTTNPFLTLDLEVWKKRLHEFLEKEHVRFKESFEVIALEKKFLINYKGFQFKGAIDRIDKVNGTYEIIDYKTSSSLSVDTIKNYDKSTDFQLEFYFLACKELLESGNIKTYYYDLKEVALKEEIALVEKLERLDMILEELHTTEVNFEMCENKSSCQFCSYRIICNR